MEKAQRNMILSIESVFGKYKSFLHKHSVYNICNTQLIKYWFYIKAHLYSDGVKLLGIVEQSPLLNTSMHPHLQPHSALGDI